MSETDSLTDCLPVLQRLALAYAPASSAGPTLALFALDARLASLVRSASEPMLAQLRLAWWREQLQADPSNRPAGDPLLDALASWEGSLPALAALVDGWEAMTGEAPLSASAIEHLADARGNAFAVLADRYGTARDRTEARRPGRNWALADIAARLSHPEERRVAGELAARQDWRAARLSRNMRPLAVLHGLAARATMRGESLDELGLSGLLAALRYGLFGR